MTTVKPCPFCGGAAKLGSYAKPRDRVECSECDAVGPVPRRQPRPVMGYPIEDHIEAWNNRPLGSLSSNRLREAYDVVSLATKQLDDILAEIGKVMVEGDSEYPWRKWPEEKPEMGQKCFVRVELPNAHTIPLVRFAQYCFFGEDGFVGVTHWMPIPELPEEK